ncbi:MAG: N-acetylmuramoyl-L-alanine amidase [Deltaproteobacteria bacterium]|nr:N-acetylmuramoyl-L-alanine amidase [Deltaproteobacteria bacterium]
MRGSQRPALPAFVLGSIVLFSATTSVCEAAVVRSLRSHSSAGVTEIVVECDASAPVHGRSQTRRDGLLFVVEIDDATLGERAARVLPVDDSRVRGVVVVGDSGSGSVRLLLDLAKAVSASVQTFENPARLEIRLTDATAAPSSARVVSPSEPVTPRPAPITPTTAAPAPAKPVRAKPAPSRQSVTARRLIVLDPGHGGKDPGAQARHGEWEKDIVLDLASRVADRLRRRLGVEVLMTRSEDVFVSLADRRATAARWGAELFVSIHANASVNTAASGIETYYHSGPESPRGSGADRATRRLVREENGRHGRGRAAGARPLRASGPAAASLVQADSKRLARNIQAELVRNLGMRYEAIRDLGVKDGRFFVLEDIDVPSVLVEAAFLTHREEGLRIHSTVYRDQVAEGIFRGIQRYLAGEAKPGTL